MGAADGQKPRSTTRYEQKGALGALLQSGSASSTLDGTLGRTRSAQSVSDLDEVYCEESNRLVRTRLLGGVGGAPGQPGPLSRSVVIRPIRRDEGDEVGHRRLPGRDSL
jgi:hypothetical protein